MTSVIGGCASPHERLFSGCRNSYGGTAVAVVVQIDIGHSGRFVDAVDTCRLICPRCLTVELASCFEFGPAVRLEAVCEATRAKSGRKRLFSPPVSSELLGILTRYKKNEKLSVYSREVFDAFKNYAEKRFSFEYWIWRKRKFTVEVFSSENGISVLSGFQ